MDARNGSSRVFELIYVAVLIAVLAIGIRWMGRGRVGVVDLHQVAGTLGMQAVLEAEAAALRQRALEQAQQLRQQWETEILPLRQAYAAAEGEDERDRLRARIDQGQAHLDARMAGLRLETQQQQRDLVSELRDLMQPAIDDAARAARVDVVLETGPSLLFRRETVDLTASVIRLARAMALKDVDR